MTFNFNWQYIIDNYPIAMSELAKFNYWISYQFEQELYNNDGPSILVVSEERGTYYTYNIRNLYDFFDSHGILIQVGPSSNWNWMIYVWNIEDDNFNAFKTSNKMLKTRTDAEMIAFEYAFEMLERKLVENYNG